MNLTNEASLSSTIRRSIRAIRDPIFLATQHNKFYIAVQHCHMVRYAPTHALRKKKTSRLWTGLPLARLPKFAIMIIDPIWSCMGTSAVDCWLIGFISHSHHPEDTDPHATQTVRAAKLEAVHIGDQEWHRHAEHELSHPGHCGRKAEEGRRPGHSGDWEFVAFSW